MKQIMTMARQFRDEEDGAAMVEYSILLGIIAAATITAVIAIGGWVNNQFGSLCDALDGKGAGGTGGTACAKNG
ncbi:pilus assembly protein Flp/PilA [Mesorhizobium soli]|uniref:Flp family type IVb pilin n=1 Tax=Pseudaminobacter soli (ex Li et al. 2025) TaxID=1295366 RepID=UPI002474E454|nr:Flp family type IVb pilin [Mesorhizobium soli]MDH6234871.1 pilus assembly protein Flp/PilA [Mesorhizobium soli]